MRPVAVTAVPNGPARQSRRRRRLRVVPASDPAGARAREMVALRKAGWTLAEIGRGFGVSRQRVGQILEASSGGHLPQREVSAARRAADASRARARAAEILEWWRRGEPIAEIARRAGLTQQSVRDTVVALANDTDRRARADVGRERLAERGWLRFSEKQLCDGLRLVARRLGHTPSKAEYTRLSTQLDLARMPTVCSRFGGWRPALRAAGFAVRGDRVRAQRWTIASCWRAVVSVLDELGDPPSYRRYVQLASVRDDLPSGSTLRLRLGLWPEIVAALREHAQAQNEAVA